MRGQRRTDITDGHKNQIRSMKAEGKRNKEVIAFMKEQYGIEINSSYVCGVCGPKRKSDPGSAAKKPDKKPSKAASEESVEKEIYGLIAQMKAAYIEKLMSIRQELIKACDEVKKNEE